MRRIGAIAFVLLAVLAFSVSPAAGTSQVEGTYFSTGSSSYVRLDGACGQQYWLHDMNGALRGSGTAAAQTHYAPVAGLDCAALHVTVGGLSFVVEKTDDLFWQ